jgi:hypothetical protein
VKVLAPSRDPHSPPTQPHPTVITVNVGQQLLQLGILVLKLPQPLGLRGVPSHRIWLPIVQRRFRDAVLARQIGRLRTGLVLAQHPDNLLFRKPGSLHLSVLQKAGLQLQLEEIGRGRSHGYWRRLSARSWARHPRTLSTFVSRN